MANVRMSHSGKRGGTRQGSGAKPKYNEATVTIAFRCPASKVDELKNLVKVQLLTYINTTKTNDASY